MKTVRIIVCFAVLAPLIFSNALAQHRPKIGVAAINLSYAGKPIPIEKIKEAKWVQREIPKVSQNIATDLSHQIKGGGSVRELPFQPGWNKEDYRALGLKEGLDILLLYDIQYVSKPRLHTKMSYKILLEALFDGQLMLLQTGETWGRSSTKRPGVQKAWIMKIAAEAGKSVPVYFHITSDPSEQICCIDGDPKGPTPRDFSAFRVIGSTTSVEVHFKKPKVICRRKEFKIEKEGQIIDETIKPTDPEEPPCQ